MIHPQAFVSGSTVAGTASVWQFASVIRGAVIGHETSIGACAIVDGAVAGERCAIGHGASVHPGTLIGDDVFVGPCAVICNDMWPATDKGGWAYPLRPTVVIEDGASIGANSTVLPGIKIGRGSVVAAGAVAERDVPDGMVLRRNGYLGRKPTNWRERRMRYANDNRSNNNNNVPVAAEG